jgi:sulfatase modifying factor 1
VQSYPPNGYGLYDMAGNVWEWCADRYDPEYFRHLPQHVPHGPGNGMERVLRGGSWLCREGHCQGFRVAARNASMPDSSLNHVGFRCVKDR